MLIAKDKYGNKYYENMEELPRTLCIIPSNITCLVERRKDGRNLRDETVRTRWVDYADKNFDPSQIEPGWHAWMSYLIKEPPTRDPLAQTGVREWEPKEHVPNHTASRGSYRCYNT